MVVKIMVPFHYPKYQVPCYNRDPKKDQNLDNSPHGRSLVGYQPIVGRKGCEGLGLRGNSYYPAIDSPNLTWFRVQS